MLAFLESFFSLLHSCLCLEFPMACTPNRAFAGCNRIDVPCTRIAFCPCNWSIWCFSINGKLMFIGVENPLITNGLILKVTPIPPNLKCKFFFGLPKTSKFAPSLAVPIIASIGSMSFFVRPNALATRKLIQLPAELPLSISAETGTSLINARAYFPYH